MDRRGLCQQAVRGRRGRSRPLIMLRFYTAICGPIITLRRKKVNAWTHCGWTQRQAANSTLQNIKLSKLYVLQKGMCYKKVRYTTVCITKWYSYKTVCFTNSTVGVTKQYVTKWYMLLNGTFFIPNYECTKRWISRTFVRPKPVP
jgi:hypothetical protein